MVALLALAIAAVVAASPLVVNIADNEFNSARVVAAARNTFTVSTPVTLEQRLGATLVEGQVSLVADKERGITGQQAKLLLERGLGELLINKGEIAIGATNAGAPSPAGVRQPAVVAALAEGRFAALHVAQSTLSIALPNGETERLNKVEATFKRAGRSGLRGTGVGFWRGQRIEFVLGTAGPWDKAKSAFPIELRVKGRMVAMDFAGSIGSASGLQLKGETTFAVPDIRRLARALGASWPDGTGLRDLVVSGPMNWSGNVLAFTKAKISVDNNKGVGALTLNAAGDKPLIAGTVAFEEFDTAPYVAVETVAAKPQDGADDGGWSRGWLARLTGAWSMPVAKLVDADIRVSVREARHGDASIGKAAMTFSLRNGALLANLAELTFEGGVGSGLVEIDFNGLVPRMTVRGKLTNAPLGVLSKALIGTSFVDGDGTITVDLVAHGGTIKQMLSGVSGTVDTTMPSGGRAALDLQAFDTRLHRRGIQGERVLEQIFARARKGVTVLKRLDASLVFANGRITARDVRANYDSRVAKLSGRADLMTRFVDMRLLIAEEPTGGADAGSAAGKPGRVDRSVTGSLTRVRGDWRAPNVALSHHVGRPTELDQLLKLSVRAFDSSRL